MSKESSQLAWVSMYLILFWTMSSGMFIIKNILGTEGRCLLSSVIELSPPSGAKIRQVCLQLIRKAWGSSAVTQIKGWCNKGLDPFISSSWQEQAREMVTNKLMLLAMLWVIKSFIFDAWDLYLIIWLYSVLYLSYPIEEKAWELHFLAWQLVSS